MSKQEKASWPAPDTSPAGEGETPGAWSGGRPFGGQGEGNDRPSGPLRAARGEAAARSSSLPPGGRADETARFRSLPPGWPGEDTGGASGVRGWAEEGSTPPPARPPPPPARPSAGQRLALGAGIVLALAGPPLGFWLTRAAPTMPQRLGLVGDGLRLLGRGWPLLLTPCLLTLALLLAGAVVAAPAALVSALARRAAPGRRTGAPGRRTGAPRPTPAGPGDDEGAAPPRAGHEGGDPTDSLVNQQEAFHYVDSIGDYAERALVEAALAHAISFLLLDERYAAESRASPMNLLTYARAVHAFARSRPTLGPLRASVGGRDAGTPPPQAPW